MQVKKAITHLKLSEANTGKLVQLAALATEYLRLVQLFIDYLIFYHIDLPNRDMKELPKTPTVLSARWLRCAWRQACGIVQSWYSNERTHPPHLHHICIQASHNVIQIERSKKPEHGHFAYWLKVSTLDAGNPIFIPVEMYASAAQTLAQAFKLCSSVTLNKQDGQWYATFVVESKINKTMTDEVVGMDVGMVHIVTTSTAGNMETSRRRWGGASKRIPLNSDANKSSMLAYARRVCLKSTCTMARLKPWYETALGRPSIRRWMSYLPEPR